MGMIDQHRRFAFERDSARFEDIGVMGELEGTVGVLFDEKKGPSLPVKPQNDIEKGVHNDRRKAEGGFVKEENPRIRHEASSDGEHLLLAAGEAAAALVAALREHGE